jgi:hypothetical protein
MKRCIGLILIALLCGPVAVLGQAGGFSDSRLAVIDDPLRVEFQGGAGGLTPEKIRQVIAIVAPNRNWKLVSESDGRFELTRTVGNKHTMRIELIYDQSGYYIRYLQSINLLYKEQQPNLSGRKLRAIHKNYNVWIRELASSINASLGVPTSVAAAGTLPVMPLLSARANSVAPAPDAPAAAAFSGAWGGRWGRMIDHVLIVESVEGRNAAFVYSWRTLAADRPAGGNRTADAYVPSWDALEGAGAVRGAGIVGSDGVLRTTLQNGAVLAYRFSADGRRLIGEYWRNDRRLNGSFDRVSEALAKDFADANRADRPPNGRR